MNAEDLEAFGRLLNDYVTDPLNKRLDRTDEKVDALRTYVDQNFVRKDVKDTDLAHAERNWSRVGILFGSIGGLTALFDLFFHR